MRETMNWINIVLLFSSIILIVVVALVTKRHGKLQDTKNRRFLEEEQEANMARKREIEPELFFYANLEKLPYVPDSDPHRVLRTSRRTMIRFDRPESNVDLKKRYGVAQLDSITQFEENFHDFLKSLGEWAQALYDEGNADGALQVLEYAIELGSEFRGTYRLAADIYAVGRDVYALERLLQMATDNYFKDPAMLEHVLSYIEEKIEELRV